MAGITSTIIKMNMGSTGYCLRPHRLPSIAPGEYHGLVVNGELIVMSAIELCLRVVFCNITGRSPDIRAIQAQISLWPLASRLYQDVMNT